MAKSPARIARTATGTPTPTTSIVLPPTPPPFHRRALPDTSIPTASAYITRQIRIWPLRIPDYLKYYGDTDLASTPVLHRRDRLLPENYDRPSRNTQKSSDNYRQYAQASPPRAQEVWPSRTRPENRRCPRLLKFVRRYPHRRSSAPRANSKNFGSPLPPRSNALFCRVATHGDLIFSMRKIPLFSLPSPTVLSFGGPRHF